MQLTPAVAANSCCGNAVALLSTVRNVVLEKNVQGIWRAGLNRSAGRSLATTGLDTHTQKSQ